MSRKARNGTVGLNPASFQIRTVPEFIYKESDQVWPNEKHQLIEAISDTESWSFYLVMIGAGKPLRPLSAKVELISDAGIVKSFVFSKDYLEHISRCLPEKKIDLLLWNHFCEPRSLEVNKLHCTLEVQDDEGNRFGKSVEVQLKRYEQKTKLIFPLKGRLVIAGGHEYNEGHRWERSQFYAFDVFPIGPKGELLLGNGTKNEDWWGYGTPVIAPADGKVVHARDDIPENEKPGSLPRKDFYEQFPNPLNAVAGNNIIIDHGHGEHSFLAHLQHGSVIVRKGEKVRQGQKIGCVGNSGNSDAPHLHYHLMDGPEIFQSNGLPSCFENLEVLGLGGKITSPKRGLFLVAK
jgi:hypothetical protein